MIVLLGGDGDEPVNDELLCYTLQDSSDGHYWSAASQNWDTTPAYNS